MHLKQNIKENNFFNRMFHLSQNKTNFKREILAGFTIFFSMAYILFVNPTILGKAGMDKGAVFTATALSTIIACLIMAFFANYPIASAPALGDNAFFTYSVVLGMGIPWQKAMAGILVASLIFVIISIFKIRETIINAIPNDLKTAMGAGIGIFIAFVGLQDGGLIEKSKSSLVQIGSLTNAGTWLTIFGLVFTAFLMAKNISGSIFIGMIATVIVGIISGLIKLPSHIISLAPSLSPTFNVSLSHLFQLNSSQMWAVILIFLIVAFFDTTGSLLGLAQQAGFIKNNKMPRMGRALMSDSFSMLAGSLMGTTPTSAYVESSTGIAIGGRTGLTTLVVAILFGFSLIFSPLISVFTSQVTAPVLIIIGVLMAKSLAKINWNRFEIALPCFLIIIGMPLTYNISYGIGFGFLMYPITMLAAGKRKEINPMMYILFFVFIILFYVLNILHR